MKTISLIECVNGTFGQDCNERCGECVEKEQCHHVNGSCVNGCKPGYRGIRCTKGSQSLLYLTQRSFYFIDILEYKLQTHLLNNSKNTRHVSRMYYHT